MAATTSTTAQASSATSARVGAASASASSVRASASAAAAAGSASKDSSSGISGGAVAGIVIAVLAGLALVGAFFWWRKKKNARDSRGSGSTLVGSAGNKSGFSKHRDDDSELFGNSLTYSGEKGINSGESFGAYNAGQWGPVQQQQNQNRPSFEAPSYHSQSQTQTPPPAFNPSTVQKPAAALIAGGAGAAGAAFSQQSDARHQEIEQREMQQHLDNQHHQQQQLAAASSAAAAGNGPFAEFPGQGAVHIVKRTFEPGLEDELILFVRLVSKRTRSAVTDSVCSAARKPRAAADPL